MLLVLDQEYNEVIDKIIKPELYKAFGHLIVEVGKIPDVESAESLIIQKASQTKKELTNLIDSLEQHAIRRIKTKEEPGSQSVAIPEEI